MQASKVRPAVECKQAKCGRPYAGERGAGMDANSDGKAEKKREK